MVVETRRAARHRRVQEGPLIPPLLLPHELVGSILGFLDIASLVQLAGCNTALRNQVLHDDYHSRDLWRVINFENVPTGMAAQISDDQLEALLHNVHTDERCQVLKLRGCARVIGYGLEPIRGSRMMREMDLRLEKNNSTGPVQLDLTFVLPLLDSMPPIARDAMPLPENSNSLGLSSIKFRQQNHVGENHYNHFDEDIKYWFIHFHAALREQAIGRRTCCSYCCSVIADMHSFEDMWCVMAAGYCERFYEVYLCIRRLPRDEQM